MVGSGKILVGSGEIRLGSGEVRVQSCVELVGSGEALVGSGEALVVGSGEVWRVSVEILKFSRGLKGLTCSCETYLIGFPLSLSGWVWPSVAY